MCCNPKTLNDWLNWQEQLHPHSIELGLDRVAHVWQRLHPQPFTCPVITIGGTNGKGSCVTLLSAILQAAGYRVGTYTSPHLLRYNERIVIDGVECDDISICAAFTRINQVRAETSLTYFEFGTLAALGIFANANLDAIILEVGLGGRLDAVNIIDPDVAMVTTVDLDHTQWLGTDRNAIAREKAGIFRTLRPAVIGDIDPPSMLLQCADQLGAKTLQAGKTFHWCNNGLDWNWYGPNGVKTNLPLPNLRGEKQLANAAAVLMVLETLSTKLPIPPSAIHLGLKAAFCQARLQILPGATVTWILDVAHNPQAARNLACELAKIPSTGQTHAIFSCLADKDAPGILQALAPQIDHWYLPQLTGQRTQPWQQLAHALDAANITTPKHGYASIHAAITDAIQKANIGDKILVTGSFTTVAAAINTGLLPITSRQ